MGAEKKKIRAAFREAVFKRDQQRCRMCNTTSAEWRIANDAVVTGDTYLDAHHITDRNLLPNGGYVVENGISLCPDCHQKAEQFHSTGVSYPGYSPEDLYKVIDSNYEKAVEASEKLKS
jgi:RNA polymerase subunit RPABC4/transcription elongation factor Spt4